jgi:hypothetical protein
MVLYDAQGRIVTDLSGVSNMWSWPLSATDVSSVIVTHLVRLLMKRHRQILLYAAG